MSESKENLFNVVHFKQITPSCFELKMIPEKPITFKAGQFTSFAIPLINEPAREARESREVRRAYSIASHPENETFDFCIKLVEGGPGSTHLSKLRAGDNIRGFAPFGHFIYKPHSEKKALFIATSTGIAPFKSMLFSEDFLQNPPKETLCLMGARDETELLYHEELKARLGNKYVPCLTRPQNFTDHNFKGRVTDFLRSMNTTKLLEWNFYLCGNGAMIKEIQAYLIEHLVPKEQIFKEAYFQPSASPNNTATSNPSDATP